MIDLIGNVYLRGEIKTLDIKLKTDNSTIGRADLNAHVYSFESAVGFGTAYKSSIQFWHEALGHSSPRSWSHASNIFIDSNLHPNSPHNFFCHSCAKFNSQHSKPHPVAPISKEPFDLVYVNLAGPFSVQSLSGLHYNMPMLNDYT